MASEKKVVSAPMQSWPVFESEEIEAVVKVLKSGKVNYWTGDQGKLFEAEYARETGTEYAIAQANGTVSLEIALRALGVGNKDEVIVPPRTFVATASSVALLGARPVFADVDIDSGNVTADSISRVINQKTKAIIVVHLGGWPCEMDEIIGLAESYGLSVIEDCAQAHGALYRGQRVGSIGRIGSFSFCQDKIISTGGEGGMLTTNDSRLWERMWSFKDHGKSYDAVYRRSHNPGFRWLHESFGTNARMTEMQAAIGRIALRKLDDTLERRRKRAQIIAEGLRGIDGLIIPEPVDHVTHSCYRFYFRVDREGLRDSWTRDRIMAEINESGVPCMSGSCSEVYLEKAFELAGMNPRTRLPVARLLGETSLTFPTHQAMTEEEAYLIVEKARPVLRSAFR